MASLARNIFRTANSHMMARNLTVVPRALPVVFSRGFSANSADPSALNDQIKEFGKAGDVKGIWNSYHEALQKGVVPSILTYNLMLQQIGKTAEKRRMREVFDEMHKHNVQPNEASLMLMVVPFLDDIKLE
eukprot:TRINITY_DN11864_c0_g1_i1.p1 TRINITY_DN11864_c0_g1~~TRINITY_DN11864_c0_g1_i1.p1  ORF type:complete len:131 (+),score=33.63 TRINITY_DN11864_c0_g1_i1:78-470(+)